MPDFATPRRSGQVCVWILVVLVVLTLKDLLTRLVNLIVEADRP